MPLAEDVEDFRRDVTKAVEALEEIKWLTDKLTECTVDELYSQITQLRNLYEEVAVDIRKAGADLIKINNKWGSGSFKIDLNSHNNGRVIKLIKTVLQAQSDFQPFQNLNQAKGILGETVCSIPLQKLFPTGYFLDGQKCENIDTISEELAYKSAHKFLSQHSNYEYAIVGRFFGGGQPYSLDVICMVINRKDVENWLHEQSTATYFVFEAKTDSAQLSKAQSQFSYVQKQALHMFTNRNKIEDRSQLGQDLLKALSDHRVVYVTSHVGTESGKMRIRFIQ
jgi:hypothetical protein